MPLNCRTIQCSNCRVWAALFSLLVVSPSPGHVGHLGGAFHAESIGAARELADEHGKLIFVYVTGPDGRACPYLERPTPRDGPLLNLLVCETVITVLTPDKGNEALASYAVAETPAMLLLDARGQELDRWPGNLSPLKCRRVLEQAIRNTNPIPRIRAALARKGANDFFTRERLACALAATGDYRSALDHFAWCVKRSVEATRGLPLGRRRVLFKAFAALAAVYPPARAALEEQRARIETVLRGARDDPLLARDLAALNAHLGEDERSLHLFDALPSRRLARHGLFDRVLELLVERRRYDELFDLIEPERAFREEAQLTRQGYQLLTAPPADELARGTRAFAVRRGAVLATALAGAGREAEACQLADAVLRFDNRSKTRDLLIGLAGEHGAQRLVEHLHSKGTASESARRGRAARRSPD